MTANGGRWRNTDAMPPGVEIRMEYGGTFFVLHGSYYTTKDAVAWGWIEPVPWPAPERVGSFA